MLVPPVLATVSTWGSGFAPPNGMLKAIGLICRNTLSPTVALMGTVTLLPAVWKEICPTKVPGICAWFGSFCGLMVTVITEGVVPLDADIDSQPPLSAVLVEAVQLKDAGPASRICSVCEGALVPFVCTEKLNCPAILSKKSELVAAIVRVTGTMSAGVFEGYSVTAICPV